MRSAILSFVGLCALAFEANAQRVAVDQGWYNGASHTTSNQNYIVGDCSFSCSPGEYRNFFVFDLSGVSSTVLRATLSLEMPTNGYLSPSPTETVTFFDYLGSIASLVGGTGGIAAFNDLGSGAVFGSLTAGPAPTMRREEIPLTAAAVAALNAAAGGNFALGGAVTTLDGSPNDEYVFGFSLNSARLVLATGGTEAYLVVGNGGGAATFYPGIHPWQTKVGTVQDWAAVSRGSFAEFSLPSGKLARVQSQGMATEPGESRFGPGFPCWMDDLFFTVQVVTFDPGLSQPEQTSNGLAVWIGPRGQVTTASYGDPQGIQVWAETFLDPNGKPAVRFPFAPRVP